MPLRADIKMKTEVFEDTGRKGTRFKRADSATNRIVDTWERENSGDLNIEATISEDLPFGDVDAVTYLHIQFEFDAAATVKRADVIFNGGADTIPITPQSGQNFAELIMEAPLNQVNITNPDPATKLKGVFIVAGDAP